MKIVFVSGFLNNHLLPICDEFSRRSVFKFIATEQRDNVTLENRDVIERDYVLYDYIPEQTSQCIDAVIDADVVVFGGSSGKYLKIRKTKGKLSFIYSERVFKKGKIRAFYPPTRKLLKDTFISNNEHTYVLCASSFLAGDIELLGFDHARCFKFGYIPRIEYFTLSEAINHKQLGKFERLSLLYVGRLLDLKNVDELMRMCALLDKKNVAYELNIIGDGPERASLEKLSRKLHLDNVVFHGSKPIDTVYKYMLDSNILYLPSNYYEGWGAVVNEALGCGCVVIETSSCGSARYLIQDGENGFVAKPNSARSLYECTLRYIDSQDKQTMHVNAYNTIWLKWNATNAVDRFISMTKAILTGDSLPKYEDGPMSVD